MKSSIEKCRVAALLFICEAFLLPQVSGIDKIIPKMKVDEFLFDPCGYSMNGILKNVSKTYSNYVLCLAFQNIPISLQESCDFGLVSVERRITVSKIKMFKMLIFSKVLSIHSIKRVLFHVLLPFPMVFSPMRVSITLSALSNRVYFVNRFP